MTQQEFHGSTGLGLIPWRVYLHLRSNPTRTHLGCLGKYAGCSEMEAGVAADLLINSGIVRPVQTSPTHRHYLTD